MTARRVLFLVNTLGHGGFERDVAALCGHLDRSRWVPEVITLAAGGVHECDVVASGVRVRSLDRGMATSPSFAVRAASAIRRSGADLWHAFLPAIGFYAALARAWPGGAHVPFVYTQGTTSFGGARWKRLAFRFTVGQADLLTANSQAAGDFLAPWSAGRPIRVLPNGHDLRRFEGPFDRGVYRRSLGVGPADPLAIFVGRLVPSKRVEDLVDAVARVCRTGAELACWVVGDGPERERLERRAGEQAVGDRVRFLGARQDVPELLRCADMFVFPSAIEGLPNAVIEAALAGLPVVAADIPGVREVLPAPEDALLVPVGRPADLAGAVMRLLADPALGRRLGDGARRGAADRFEIGRVCAAVCDCYDELIAGARTQSGGRRVAALSPLTPGAVRGDRPSRRGACGGAA